MRFLSHMVTATISWVWTRCVRLPEPEFISGEDAEMLTKATSKSSAYMGMDAAFAPADKIFKDGETVNEAGLDFKVLATPGHTRGGVCLVCGDVVFCGDTVFAESIGRTDLPGGSYKQILNSIKDKILVLLTKQPLSTNLFVVVPTDTSIDTFQSEVTI